MKIVTKIFLTLIMGLILGYAWASSSYLPQINHLQKELTILKDN